MVQGFGKTTYTRHTGINTLTEDEVLEGIISKKSTHETGRWSRHLERRHTQGRRNTLTVDEVSKGTELEAQKGRHQTGRWSRRLRRRRSSSVETDAERWPRGLPFTEVK